MRRTRTFLQRHLHKKLQRQHQRSSTTLNINPTTLEFLLLSFLLHIVKKIRFNDGKVEDTTCSITCCTTAAADESAGITSSTTLQR